MGRRRNRSNRIEHVPPENLTITERQRQADIYDGMGLAEAAAAKTKRNRTTRTWGR